jgi:hypothetical protein
VAWGESWVQCLRRCAAIGRPPARPARPGS